MVKLSSSYKYNIQKVDNSMSNRNRHNLTNTELQSEQLRLVKVQKELEGILGKVNEALNSLKVEELHLKSSAVDAMKIQQISHSASEILRNHDFTRTVLKSTPLLEQSPNLRNQELFVEEVNRQEINLNPCALQQKMVEEEEDEDE